MKLSHSKIKKLLIFPEMKPCTFQLKTKTEEKFIPGKILILQETETSKKIYIFSQEEAVLIYREKETP